MALCPGCGGIVGRDCFNPSECEWISRDMEMRAVAERVYHEREYEDHMRGLERAHHAAMANAHALTTDAQWGAARSTTNAQEGTR